MEYENDYESLRERNLKELEAFLAETVADPEFNEAVETFKIEKPEVRRATKPKKHNDDYTIRFSTVIPNERRTSNRLANKPPPSTDSDYKDEVTSDSDVENLEKVIFKKRKIKSRKSIPFKIILVENITDSYLANVARRETIKKYSPNGSSCHQCRQKTLDSKTYCRSSTCIGVRGQFCGPCLGNRYGEDAIKALKDPNWICPPCRGICNCSICRTREGKRPTGILAPLAFRHGHNSVKDFLQSLNGKGEKNNTTDSMVNHIPPKTKIDEGNLLGFIKNSQAVMTRKPYDNEEVFLLGFKNNVPVTNVEYNIIELFDGQICKCMLS